ncbi:hypothetical protein GF324_09695 [bacterium]|nr:hypothetical protein [bacterium]
MLVTLVPYLYPKEYTDHLRRFIAMHVRTLVFSLTILVLLLAGNASATRPQSPVVQWVLEGRLDTLRAASIQPPAGLANAQLRLARALVEPEGLSAYAQLHRLASEPSLLPEEKTLVHFHLHGYYRLVGENAKADEHLAAMRPTPGLSASLFHDGILPEPTPVVSQDLYAIQVGAFSSRANADRYANGLKGGHEDVTVQPLNRASGTLYAVWLGRFPDADAARQYGTRQFGREGKDYTVVKRGH